MSDFEMTNGKIRLVSKDPEAFIKKWAEEHDLIDEYREEVYKHGNLDGWYGFYYDHMTEHFLVANNCVFEAKYINFRTKLYEVKNHISAPDKDGWMDMCALFYNGGASLIEVAEELLAEKDERLAAS